MRPAAIAWDRAATVQAAARRWRDAGAIDDATLARIRQTFPDPCLTPTPAWRVLTAGMVAAIVLCVFAALLVSFWRSAGLLQAALFLVGAACLVITDRLAGSPRWARRGVAGALSVLGVGFLLLGVALLVGESLRLGEDAAVDAVAVTALLLCGLAAWRWGSPLFTGLAGVALLVGLARLPSARALWIAAGAGLVAAAAPRLDSGRLAPSQRRGAAVLTAVGLGAIYVATDLHALDAGLLERLGHLAPTRPAVGGSQRLAAALGTALIPPAILAWGLVSRRTLLLDIGIVLLALSAVTLRHYVALAPAWVMLTGGGALLAGAALLVERALRRAPAGERAGFTAEPLFSDERRQQTLEMAGAVTTFAPRTPAPPDEGFAGGGGRFGGGGAQERF
ncbi:MAG TPA: hypothetical protein VFE48_00915 [Methylomirabilota bacterium]|nr:hypothetical protein [Methylomirabilota bacterium]